MLPAGPRSSEAETRITAEDIGTGQDRVGVPRSMSGTYAGPRRILHVTEAPLGGVITCLQELLRGQVARDLDRIEVITPEINLEVLGAIASDRLHLTPYAHARGDLGPLATLARLTISRARDMRPDILHVHSTIAGAVVRLCRPFLPRGTKIIYCPHGWAFLRSGGAAKTRAIAQTERMLSLVTDRIHCVSVYERTDGIAIGIAPDRLVVVENGVSPLAGLPTPGARTDDRKTVVFAGRFDEQKGFDTYVEVMRRLGSQARGLAIGRAIVSGQAPVGLPENIELLGWQPREKVAEICASADVLLMPSRWEGFPLVALEAMQARTAVFATRVGGLQDIILDGETGRLFAPDDAAGMAAAIEATSLEQFNSFGASEFARYSELYTADVMNARIWELYSSLCAAPSARPV